MPIFQELGTALNLFSVEDSKYPIAVVDKNNHLSKQFLSLFYKWKALAHVKSQLPSAKDLSFSFMLSLHLLPYAPIKRA
jgi:hypothetical protein